MITVLCLGRVCSVSSHILTFEHSELGTLEVLVTGTLDHTGHSLNGFKVYYGSYDITRDLSEEDRLKVLSLALEEERRAD